MSAVKLISLVGAYVCVNLYVLDVAPYPVSYPVSYPVGSGGSSTITAPVRGIELSGERDTKKGNFIPPQCEGKLCHDMAVKPEQINKIKREEMK